MKAHNTYIVFFINLDGVYNPEFSVPIRTKEDQQGAFYIYVCVLCCSHALVVSRWQLCIRNFPPGGKSWNVFFNGEKREQEKCYERKEGN
jgi:hypothetical protein